VRFWDASALVPLLVSQARSAPAAQALADDTALVVAWTTEIECASAVSRIAREPGLDSPAERAAFARLADLSASWTEVQPTAVVRLTAIRLVRAHPLRAGDSIQLASAIATARDAPRELPFVTLDERLAEAAEREGFRVLIPDA